MNRPGRRILSAFLMTSICAALSAGFIDPETPDQSGDRADSAAQAPGDSSSRPIVASDLEPSVPASASIRNPDASSRRDPAALPAAVIREPSQGRPIFLTPGETFYFIMDLGNGLQGDVAFRLRHSQEPTLRFPLKPTSPPTYVDDYCHLVLMVPTAVVPGLYDLEVSTPSATHYAKHSISVVEKFKDRFRFVHLSNMNIGDLTAPEFDDMLPAEINLLAPEFIIATGDYTEWARARDDAQSWLRILSFFEKFNAPVFMLCGAHDHEPGFTRLVSNKLMDELNYGNYHGLLLLDHPGNPIDQDADQIAWVDADLKKSRNKTFNFIASNSDELGLLSVWRERGDLAAFINQNRIKLFITGGASDWDYIESADQLAGLDGVHFVRTHESSTAQRDRATGFSHYRVFEVTGDQFSYVYPDDHAAQRLQHSIPTGRLRAFFDGANDGATRRVGVTVQNALNQPFPNAHVWLRIAKQGDAKPLVSPGRLERVLDVGHYWACDVSLDLPEKTAVRLVASTDPRDIPDALPIEIKYDGPPEWSFTSQNTDFGLTYHTSEANASIQLTNTATAALTCWPVVRINGTQLPIDRTVCPKLPLTIEPGKSTTLPLVLNLLQVSPGPHTLQVYFLEDPLSRLTTFEIMLAQQQPQPNS